MESAKLGLLPNFCGATLGIDDSLRESDPNVGALEAKAVGRGVINTGVESFVGTPVRPVRSLGGGISSTLDDGWSSEVTVWSESTLSLDRLGMGSRADRVFIQGVLAGPL